MQHAYVHFRAYRVEAVLDREVNVRKRQHVGIGHGRKWKI